MALSEEEQRLLAQLEASLSMDDPSLAQTLRGESDGPQLPKRLGLAIGGILLGLVGVVLGVLWQPVVGVLGFVLMLVAAGQARFEPRRHDPSTAHPSHRSQPRRTAGPFPGARPTDEGR